MGFARIWCSVFFVLVLFDREFSECIEQANRVGSNKENKYEDYGSKLEKPRLLYDYQTRAVAYKDLTESKCFLEILTTKNSLLGRKWSNFRTDKLKWIETNSKLSKREIWRLGGQRILDFCRDFPSYLIQSTSPHNARLSNRIWQTHSEIDIRRKRNANSHSYGNVRGQTQSQYLNFAGSNNQEGLAEAESSFNGTKAIVSGSNGMGQAQSQSSPVDCIECFGNYGQDHTVQYGHRAETGLPKLTAGPGGQLLETSQQGRPIDNVYPGNSQLEQIDSTRGNFPETHFDDHLNGNRKYYHTIAPQYPVAPPPQGTSVGIPVTGGSGLGQTNVDYPSASPGHDNYRVQLPIYSQQTSLPTYQVVQPGQQRVEGIPYPQQLPLYLGSPMGTANTYPAANILTYPDTRHTAGHNLPANLVQVPTDGSGSIQRHRQDVLESVPSLNQGNFGGQLSGQYAGQTGHSGRFSGSFQGNFQTEGLQSQTLGANTAISQRVPGIHSVPLNYEIETQKGYDRGTIGNIQHPGNFAKRPDPTAEMPNSRIVTNQQGLSLQSDTRQPTTYLQEYPQNIQSRTVQVIPGVTPQDIQNRVPQYGLVSQTVPLETMPSVPGSLHNVAALPNQYKPGYQQIVPGGSSQVQLGPNRLYLPNVGTTSGIYQGVGQASYPQGGTAQTSYPWKPELSSNYPDTRGTISSYPTTYATQLGSYPGIPNSYSPSGTIQGVYPQYLPHSPGSIQYTKITDVGNAGGMGSSQVSTNQQIGQPNLGNVPPGQYTLGSGDGSGKREDDKRVGSTNYDDSDSQVQSSIQQTSNGTIANAQAQGKYQGGSSQSQVSGTYSGSGSFSASAGSDDGKRGALTQVSGGKDGAQSSAQGRGGIGQSQVQVVYDSNSGDTLSSAQTTGIQHGTQTQVHASENGGLADAQANGLGATSSQAQIGFIPEDENKNNGHTSPFSNGGNAAAQSRTHSGMTQTQIQGKLRYGMKYQGAAQAGSGTTALRNLTEPTGFFKPINFTVTKSTGTGRSQSQKAVVIPSRENPVTQDSVDLPPSDSNTARTTILPQNNVEESVDKLEDDDYAIDYNDQDASDEDVPAGSNSTPSKRNSAQQDDLKHSSGKKSLHVVQQSSPTQTQHIVLDPLENLDATIYQSRGGGQSEKEMILQPRESFPGSGYKIPVGFRGRVKSLASGPNTYAIGKNSQAQSVTLSPGSGKITYPKPVYAVSTKTLYKDGGYGTGYSYQPITYRLKTGNGLPDFVSLSKSEVGSKNIKTGQKTPNIYYTQSSSCGMFTNSCVYMDGKKSCFPVRKSNPDGSFISC